MIAVLVPVVERPASVERVVLSLYHSTPAPLLGRVVFLCTPGHPAEEEAVRAAQRDLGGPIAMVVMDDDYVGRGDYARKINVGTAITSEPYVFTAADDVVFHPGWAERTTMLGERGNGVVGTNDLCNKRVMRGEHSTHTLVARWYVEAYGTADEPGKVMHEGYPHECCDDELVQTAQARGLWAFAPDAVVEHLHPTVGKAPWDDTYIGSTGRAERMAVGRALLAERRPLWS